MQSKTKARELRLKDECYNCRMLFGRPFNPRCFARKDPMRGGSDEK